MSKKKLTRRDLLPFGKVLIDATKLSNGIISLCDIKGKKLNDSQNARVSPDLRLAFIDIIKKREPNLKSLTSTERRFLSDSLIKARFSHMLPLVPINGGTIVGCVCVSGTKLKKLQNQLDIVEGEIEAGNDSTELWNQLTELLDHMVLCGAMTDEQVNKILKEAKFEEKHDGKSIKDIEKENKE